MVCVISWVMLLVRVGDQCYGWIQVRVELGYDCVPVDVTVGFIIR